MSRFDSFEVNVRKLLYIAVSLGLLLSLSFVPELLRSSCVLYSYAKKQQPAIISLYVKYFGYKSTITDTEIAGRHGSIPVRVYTPLKAVHPATILIVHGFAPEGNKHPVMNALAARLAEVGFRVVLPTIAAETIFQMKVSDLDIIDDVIFWSADKFQRRVSVAGVSFGGGLAIAATMRPDVVSHVAAVLSISGYNNLDTIGHLYIHDRVLDPNGVPYAGHGPPAGPLLFISQYLEEMVSHRDALALQLPIDTFKHHAADHVTDAVTQSLAKLSKEQLGMFHELQSVDSPAVRQRYLNILDRHRQEIEELSPSTHLPTSKANLFVLHGKNDPAIPAAEVEWMRHESSSNPNAHFLVSPWLTHADAGRPTNVFEKLKVAIFFDRFLRKAASP